MINLLFRPVELLEPTQTGLHETINKGLIIMHTEVYANQRASAQTEQVKSTKSPDNFLHLLPEHCNEITNQWLTHLVTQRISGNGMRLLNTIYRHTIGFDKIADDMSGLRLQQISHIRADHANHMVEILAADNAIIRTKGRYGKVLSINFHFASWGKANERSSDEPIQHIIQHIADPRHLLPKRYYEDPIDTGNVVGANYDEILDSVNYSPYESSDPSDPYLNPLPETATKTAVERVLQTNNPLEEQTTLTQVLQRTTHLFETLLEKIERLEQRMDAKEAEKTVPSNKQNQTPKTTVKKTKKATKRANTNNDNQATASTRKTAITKHKRRNSKAETGVIKEQKPCAKTKDKSHASKAETVPITEQNACTNRNETVVNTVLEINTTAPNLSEYFLQNTVVEWVQTEAKQPIDNDNHHSESQADTEVEDTNNHQNTEQKSNKNKDLHYPDILGEENRTPLMNLIKRVPKHAQDILDLLALRMNNTRDPINNMAQYCSTLVRVAQNGQLDTDALKANRAQRKIALDPKKKQWDTLQAEYRDALSEYEHFDRINKGQANYNNCTVEEYLEESGMATNWNNILKRLEKVKREIDALGYTP